MAKIVEYHPAGTYTTDDSLDMMKRAALGDYASREIQELVADITSNLHPEDQRSQMLAVRNWVLANFQFVLDAKEAKRLFNVPDSELEHGELEMIKTPLQVLETRRYDCDCIASFLAACLMALGIQCRFVAASFLPVSMTGPDGYSHVYAEGFDGQEWIILDPVSHPKEKNMLKDTIYSKVFNVS